MTVDTGLRKITRSVRIASEDMLTIKETLYKDTAFTSIYKELPECTKMSLSLSDYEPISLPESALQDLYKTMKEEIASTKGNEWMTIYKNSNRDAIDFLYFGVNKGGSFTTGKLPIISSLPATYQKYISYVNDTQHDMLKNFVDKAMSITYVIFPFYFPLLTSSFLMITINLFQKLIKKSRSLIISIGNT